MNIDLFASSVVLFLECSDIVALLLFFVLSVFLLLLLLLFPLLCMESLLGQAFSRLVGWMWAYICVRGFLRRRDKFSRLAHRGWNQRQTWNQLKNVGKFVAKGSSLVKVSLLVLGLKAASHRFRDEEGRLCVKPWLETVGSIVHRKKRREMTEVGGALVLLAIPGPLRILCMQEMAKPFHSPKEPKTRTCR